MLARPPAGKKRSASTRTAVLRLKGWALSLVISSGIALSGFQAPAAVYSQFVMPAGKTPGPSATQREKTHDDLLLEIARRVPSFGGMYTDAQGHLYVYLLEPDARVEAEAAIRSVFGPDTLPAEGIRVVLAQYSFLDLKAWHDRLTGVVLNKPGVVLTDVDESRNRLLIGTITGKPPARLDTLLKKLAIPREAVIVEKVEPIGPLPQKRTRKKRSSSVEPSVGHLPSISAE